MKTNLILIVLFLISVFTNSCNQEIEDIAITNQKVAMEIFTHSTIIEQIEYLQMDLHRDFLSPDLIAKLEKNPFLKKKLLKNSEEIQDTIFSYDEILLIRESKNQTIIFNDGRSEYYSEHLTPFEQNPLCQLTANPEPEGDRISKTVLKDGFLSVYNVKNELIVQEVYPIDNMKEFLDTMRVFVEMSTAKNQMKSTDNAFKIRSIRQYIDVGGNVSELSNGNTLIEFPMQSTCSSNEDGYKISGILKSRLELNPEMTKTLRFEIFQGDYLIHRKQYTYRDTEMLKNIYDEEIILENPESIESEILFTNAQGIPVIRHSKEFFYRNQSLYYFK
ncbi:MAG: hypothetical protein Q7J05_02305 [Paludibacter sp.]|nr:hypothetical protein [Paludibacter sp.]